MPNYQNISLWLPECTARAALAEDLQVDVAIVGAGYTGLWAAYYLKRRNPQLSIAILEAEVTGYGASGRNGGWLMGELAGQDRMLRDCENAQQAREIIHDIPAEAAQVFAREHIDCDFSHGGALRVAARYPEQLEFERSQYESMRAHGYSDEDVQWLSADEMRSRLNVEQCYGGTYTPHVARVHPGKLVRELARCVEAQGVRIFEQSPVTRIDSQPHKHHLTTPQGEVTAEVMVMAVEGFSYHQPQFRHRVLPIQSMIIATEPLSEAMWQSIGLQQNETFADTGRLVTYGQRTADQRMVFGARGSYRFGGLPKSDFSDCQAHFSWIENTLKTLLPVLADTEITHCWGGTMGFPRAFHPHAVFDKASGLATAGGYLGEGVGGSNLMARTLADMILEQDSPLVSMPWAHRQDYRRALRRWEPEPFKWLGYKTINFLQKHEDLAYSNPQASRFRKSTLRGLGNLIDGFLG